MVDITAAKLFWAQWCSKMADRVKDFAYTDDTKETVDIINLLLLGWVLLGLVVYILGNVIATQFRKRKSKNFVETTESPVASETAVRKATEIVTASVPNAAELHDISNDKLVQVPVCSGQESDVVLWLNNVFTWIYNQRVVSPVFDSWLSALNTRTRLLSTEHGILVDFQNVVHCNEPPVITNAYESVGSKGLVNVLCDAEVPKLVFEVVVTQVQEKNKNIFTFLLNLHRIAGQLSIDCVPEVNAFFVRFADSPQIELEVEQDLAIPPEESEALRDLICEIASEALSTSTVDLRLACFTDCPKYSEAEYVASPESEEVDSVEPEERLLVKIIKADNLCSNQAASKPYCVVEMDDPLQHFETSVAEDGTNPIWDSSFVFTCKSLSADLLFEVYDKSKPANENFLGLCILSVEELIRNPAQQQVIMLQPRPLEKDEVTGSITAEFSFMDYNEQTNETTKVGTSPTIVSEIDVQPGKTVQTNSRVTAGGTIITTTTIKRTNEGANANTIAANDIDPTTKLIQMMTAHNISQSRQQFLKGLIHENGSEHMLSNLEEMHATENCVDRSSDSDDCNDEGVKCSKSEVVLNGETKCETGLVQSDHKPNHTNASNGTLPNSNGPTQSANGPLHAVTEFVESSGNDPVEIKKLHENEVKEADNISECIADMEYMLPCIVEEHVDLGSSSSTLVENKVENDAEDLTNAALKELEKQNKPSAPDKSTLIIHSVQRTDTSGTDSLEASPASHPSADSRSSNQLSLPPSPSIQRNGVDRSRPKEKKSLLGNLRKKLSFRKMRSKSMELRSNSSPISSEGNNRSVSTERAKSSLAIRETASLKSARRYLAVPGSTRSSFSEASGLSTASSRTYINENSTLVVEINENGIIKRYLIPTSMIHRSKWKKKGIKLHLYNDHVFVAKHLSGSSLCQVCNKHLTRRPGKQGYVCRDCNLQCHKSCHVKVAEFCPNSSVTSMEVEYIHDPKVTKPKSA